MHQEGTAGTVAPRDGLTTGIWADFGACAIVQQQKLLAGMMIRITLAGHIGRCGLSFVSRGLHSLAEGPNA